MISQYRKGTGINMINFEEELKNFKPSLEVEDIEEAVYQEDMTDMTDILREMMKQNKQRIRVKFSGVYKKVSISIKSVV